MSQVLKKLEELELELEETQAEPQEKARVETPALHEVKLDTPPGSAALELEGNEASSSLPRNIDLLQTAAATEPASETLEPALNLEAPVASVETAPENRRALKELLEQQQQESLTDSSGKRRLMLLIGLLILSGTAALGWRAFRNSRETAGMDAPDQVRGNLQDPKESLENRYQAALLLLGQDQPGLALGSFQQLEKEFPRNIPLKLAVAQALERTKKPSLAEKKFKETLALDPKNPATLNNYGIFLIRNGNADQGLILLEEAEKNDPSLAGAILNQARGHEELADWSTAVECYDRYLLHPNRDPKLVGPIQKRLARLEALARHQERSSLSTDKESLE